MRIHLQVGHIFAITIWMDIRNAISLVASGRQSEKAQVYVLWPRSGLLTKRTWAWARARNKNKMNCSSKRIIRHTRLLLNFINSAIHKYSQSHLHNCCCWMSCRCHLVPKTKDAFYYALRGTRIITWIQHSTEFAQSKTTNSQEGESAWLPGQGKQWKFISHRSCPWLGGVCLRKKESAVCCMRRPCRALEIQEMRLR